MKNKLFITGVTGFVGSALLSRFVEDGAEVRVLVRSESIILPDGVKRVVGDLSAVVFEVSDQTRSQSKVMRRDAFDGIDVVVHAAARVHVMREHADDALAAFREVNVAGTMRLALQAAEAGVQRFIFLSSIGVNGNQSVTPFTEADPPQPRDDYAISKFEAEQQLFALADQSGMEVVVIRPPLVYGPNAPGNFGSLVKWVFRGIPLPLGAVHNQRSFVALDNLTSLVLLCADRSRSPQAANQVFVVADGEDVSTTTLLRKVALSACRPSRLVPVPASLLRVLTTMLGKRAVADRLLGNLQVDATKVRILLGWCPVVTMDEQLATIFKEIE